MKDLSKHIAQEIEARKLTPRPRWRFFLRDSFLAGLMLLTTVLGAFAVATVIFLATNYDWPALRFVKEWVWYLLFVAPYAWFLALVILVVVTWKNFVRTKYGYRYEAWVVAALSFVGSLVMGIGFYFFGFGTGIHSFLLQNFSYYPRVVNVYEELWEHPERGFLGGTVVAVLSEEEFLLRDARGGEWRVIIFTAHLQLEPGTQVRLAGEIAAPNVFFARSARQ